MSKIINIDSFLVHFFEDANRWFHVREMARLSRVNPTTASKYLIKLHKENLLIKKYEKGHLLFKANNENDFYKDAKVYFNVRLLRHSGLIGYLDKELHYPEAIVLFGSCSKGENDKNSDFDLFAVSNVKKELDLGVFEKKIKARIQLFIKNKKEFINLQKENKNLANGIINGIVIKGYIEVFA